jgi:hypothetical protein
MEIGDTWVRTLLKCKLTCIAGDKWIINGKVPLSIVFSHNNNNNFFQLISRTLMRPIIPTSCILRRKVKNAEQMP